MKRLTNVTTAIFFFACLAGLGIVAPAQADLVTDTFELKATVKEWCKDNPKFFENFKIKAVNNVTLKITRDVNGDDDFTDIQATINTNGASADIDAITMNGLAFPRNKAGSKAELALSGVNPGNPDHFFTVRGQATFDKAGNMTNLTKVTGTFVYQITDTYSIDKFGTQSDPPVECFASGTFGTGKRILVP